MKDILVKFNSGQIIQNRLTIPEGMTNAMIFEMINSIEYLSGKLELKNFPSEGFIAPDTYFYEMGQNKLEILNKITLAQERKISKIWKNRANSNILKSSKELIILASIIEKEAGNKKELKLISSVLHNRLNKNMRLQADPTVIYGITNGKKKFKRSLNKKDLRNYTAFNTYMIKGLPLTAICNPGEAALIAAANPAKTNYFYYVSNTKGGHFFSENLEEHNKNVKLYKMLNELNN